MSLSAGTPAPGISTPARAVHTLMRWTNVAAALALIVSGPAFAAAQAVRGVVVDQTELPLPGATVHLVDDRQVVATTTTRGDGTFEMDAPAAGSTVVASLDGFETTSVPRSQAQHIVLPIARATETTTVTAPLLVPSSPTTTLLGNSLAADAVARMPSAHLKARDSLPLLPSVVRGPDGLLQLGGARPHETPLMLDGFNVTDPATGASSINLPFEAVEGVQVLRDPIAVTYGQLLGGVMELQTRPGGDHFATGVQGFVPRPRLQNPGAGRLEGIFPRAYAGGAAANGRFRYFAAAEYDFERIPVPGVTQGGGPDLVEKSSVVFGRADAQWSSGDSVTIEGLSFPSGTDSLGLSPRREQSATTNLRATDRFAGLIARHVFDARSTVTVRLGMLTHETTFSPNGGRAAAGYSWAGWQDNWFSSAHRRSTRYNVSATWERSTFTTRGSHDTTLVGDVATQQLRGTVSEQTLFVRDTEGRLVRSVEFGPAAAISAKDWPVALALRDVWSISDRVQLDMGVRMDESHAHGGYWPSARAGVRYAFGPDGLNVVKAGYGGFIGSLPLGAGAFGGSPLRIDRQFDAETGGLLSEVRMQPRTGRLRLPRALAATVQFERRLWRSLDAQFGFTRRTSARLATLGVPVTSGPATVDSTGTSSYHEIQISMQREWKDSQKVFFSYVRSWSNGELNDFATLFQTSDTPLLQPGGQARLSTDVRHRWIIWGTVNLPRRVVISPVFEWRSGFPYSVVDVRSLYAGPPNGSSYPAFMTTDIIAYKTFTVRKRSADFGMQLFNATNHFNPRDVYNTIGAPRFGQFTNSVGPIIRGFMMIKW